MSQLSAETLDVYKRRKLMIEKQAISATENDRFDVVGNLPSELVQIIFSHLKPSDLRSAFRTCRKWKNLASSEFFWKHRCKTHNYLQGNEETSDSKVWESFFRGTENYWERIYVYNEALHQNWLTYVFREKICNLPRGTPRIHYLDDKIVIMTYGTERIYVYDYYAKKYVYIFPVPPTGLESHVISKTLDFVVCVNRFERYVIVWSITTGLCQLELALSCNKAIHAVVIDKNLVALLFYGGSCQIVNILSGKVEYNIPIDDNVYCLCFLEDQVAFGYFSGGAVKILNWPDKLITATLSHDETTKIYRIMASGDYLISFCTDDIRIWSLQSRTLLHSILYRCNGLVYNNATLLNPRTLLVNVVMQNHETLLAWDIVDGVCKFTIVLSRFLKDTIIMNQHYVFAYSTSWNSTLFEVWCKRTGEPLTKFSIKDKVDINALVTDTKLIYLTSANLLNSMHILDFEKEIKLGQLDALYA